MGGFVKTLPRNCWNNSLITVDRFSFIPRPCNIASDRAGRGVWKWFNDSCTPCQGDISLLIERDIQLIARQQTDLLHGRNVEEEHQTTIFCTRKFEETYIVDTGRERISNAFEIFMI